MRSQGFVAALAVVSLTLAACGSSDTAPPLAPAPATTTTAAVASPSAAPKAATIKVPDGVGLDYQSAQDLWRAAGLHVAPAEDATGAKRIPVIDRNWIVVSQSPKAGATVDEDSVITATVKKNTDG